MINNDEQFENLGEILNDFAARVREATRPALEAISQFQENFAMYIAPAIRNIMENIKISPETLEALRRAGRNVGAISKLADVQYVYWDYLEEDFVELISTSTNINKTLREYHIKNKFRILNVTVGKCKKELPKHDARLFEQAIKSFENYQYDLVVIGLLAIIDSLLSTTSGKYGTHTPSRAERLINKIDEGEEITNDEYSLIILIWTFQKTIDSIFAKSDFKQENYASKEPKGLNRHWIMHGRSRKKKTKLDCIKLINLIYAIIIISAHGEECIQS